tara:strand:- start:451 stop:621 length:171 start_codon:yes stop_codon:yes gene_type:complete
MVFGKKKTTKAKPKAEPKVEMVTIRRWNAALSMREVMDVPMSEVVTVGYMADVIIE